MLKKIVISLVIFCTCINTGEALSFEQIEYKGHRYITVEVDLVKYELKHYWKNSENTAYESLQTFKQELDKTERKLLFAINSGIYSKEYIPLGLHIEEYKVLVPLNEVIHNAGMGNFSLLPNGVFFIDKNNRAGIVTTDQYAKFYKNKKHDIRYATQSGPMLLINGDYNPRFIKDSDSLKIRSGVCVLDDIYVRFVITENAVSFYQFASFFKEEMQCENALYLDGTLARLYYDGDIYGASILDRMRKLVGFWAIVE